ncbi:lipase maturation factor family protein [candidate division TA06 bacterium]|nr:lipase maturation factor family protein [candidate division TA06 bacterium]
MKSRGSGRVRVIGLFLSLLGVVHFFAFFSLALQVRGLMGSEGIFPIPHIPFQFSISNFKFFISTFHEFPTLFLFSSNDLFLQGSTYIGLLLSLLLIIGYRTRPVLILLWILYLSYVTGGRGFFNFQWDNLLLEATFLAIFLPSRRGPFWRRSPLEKFLSTQKRIEPHPLIIFLFQWLLFRLMFESGLSKVLVPNGGWLDLTAMSFYYETAPLPTLLGWVFHNFPDGFHKIETVLALSSELIIPFFIFATHRVRGSIFLLFSLFQVGIFLTGNYGFFNLLSLALGVFFLDDGHIEWAMKKIWLRERLVQDQSQLFNRLHQILPSPAKIVVGILLVLTIFEGILRFGPTGSYQRIIFKIRSVYAPFRIANVYHLFAHVTRERVEVEIQGTMDGKEWKIYEFRHKPGDLKRAPTFVAPHQPRVDFQLWFFTLSRDSSRHQYFNQLLYNLCHRPRSHNRLFRVNPFSESPPSTIRLAFYRYTMTDWETLKKKGTYWNREFLGFHPQVYQCDSTAPPRY